MPITFSEQKQRYLDKFLHLLKEYNKTRQSATKVLDLECAALIVNSAQMAAFDPAVEVQKPQVAIVGFRDMKRQAQASTGAQENVEMAVDEPLFQEQITSQDKVYEELMKTTVVINELKELPHIDLIDKNIVFT
jgi:hypothetical protein